MPRQRTRRLCKPLIARDGESDGNQQAYLFAYAVRTGQTEQMSEFNGDFLNDLIGLRGMVQREKGA